MPNYRLFIVILATALIGLLPPHTEAKTAHPGGKLIPLDRLSAGPVEPAAPSAGGFSLGRPSTRNLLGLEREKPFGLPRAALQQERVIKLLAIRVEFVQEEVDDPTTTGDGTFDLRDSVAFKAEYGHLFDASPHDSAYFGKHIEALNNYWHTVSNGKVSIEGTIYPPEPNGFYKLPEPMAYYGAQPPSYGLTDFFFDAFRAADTQNPEIDFSAYDAFCVFHAGADQQNDIGFPVTANDLWTGFIVLGKPIPVDDGTFEITEGVIMPETVAQDNRIVVLNSVFAHEFGHQLGLVDWYSTRTFITQIGNFSLMDNNAFNVGGDIEVNGRARQVFGILPVFPDAWSRAYLGFINVDTAYTAEQAYTYAAEMEDPGTQAVLVPISSTEYFMLENRRRDIDGEAVPFILQDSVTNVILGPVNSDTVFTREYDYLLPGDGLLIWHIDETVGAEDELPDDDIPNNWEANTLQWNYEKRFISLIEADWQVSFLGNGYIDFGVAEDMFAAPNRRVFSPDTPIPTDANSGARTGITIVVNSEALPIMDFAVLNDQTLPGFPVWCGPDSTFSPLVTDIDGDGSPEVFVGSGDRILGWHFDGTPLFDNEIADTVLSFGGDPVVHKTSVAALLPSPLATPPLVSIIDGIGDPNVIAADQSRLIHLWRLTDFSGSGFADSVFAVESELSLSGPVILFNQPGSFTKNAAFALTGGGILSINGGTRDTLHYYDIGAVSGIAGTEADNAFYLRAGAAGSWRLIKLTDEQVLTVVNTAEAYGPIMGDLDRDGELEIICAGSNGLVWAFDQSLTPKENFPVDVGGPIGAAPVVGDIDDDGYLEIVTVGDNAVYAINFNGTIAEDFPVIIDRYNPTGLLRYPPILIDPPGERTMEILVTTPGGVLFAVYPRESGQAPPRQLASGYPGQGSPAYGYDALTGTSALWTVGGDGFLYGFILAEAGEGTRGIFTQEGYAPERTNVFPLDSLPDLPGEESLLTESSVYAYPNPVRGGLVNFRCRLGEAAQINLAIYDVAGNLIAELQATGIGGTENEITWDCSGVASGVYFGRMAARADSGKESVVFCPIAIAR